MQTQIRIVKKGADHVELQVDSEAAADLLADEANRKDIKPVIGQRLGFENTEKHYVVLNGVASETASSTLSSSGTPGSATIVAILVTVCLPTLAVPRTVR